MRSFVPVFLFCAASVLGQTAEVRNPRTTPEDVAAGGRIYRSHCAECHGLAGEGGRGPNLTMGIYRHGGSDEALLKTISRGIPGTEMPGIYFTEAQVWQIVAFVKDMGAARKAVPVPGDPEAGASLFHGKGGCAGCHMVAGKGGRAGPDLSEIGAARTPEHLRRSLTDPSAEVNSRYWTVTVHGRDGKSYSGRRLNEDTYTIQILDSQENLRSLPKSGITDIKENRESSMPSYSGLSEVELDNLVAYMSSLRGRKGGE
jgi:putative heme-binding domain-containing protein